MSLNDVLNEHDQGIHDAGGNDYSDDPSVPSWDDLVCQPWLTPSGTEARVRAIPRDQMSPESVKTIDALVDSAYELLTERNAS